MRISRLRSNALMCIAILITAAAASGGWLPQPIVQINQTSDSIRSRFFVPDTSRGGKYPLVIHLHGNGQGQNTLDLKVPPLNAFADTSIQNHTPCFILAPACPQNARQPKWVLADWGQCTYSFDTVNISISTQLVVDQMKKLCKTYPIDTNRVHVCGGSMGGMGTWDAITRFPNLFASGTPLSGAGDPTKAAASKNVPVWAFALAGDKITPSCGPSTMIEALRTAGSFPRYTVFTHEDFHLWDQIWYGPTFYTTMQQIPWMLRQVKSTSAPAQVTGLSATAAGSYRVNLAWSASTDAVGDPLRIHYLVYRGTTLIATIDSLKYGDTDSLLKENAQYSYTVKAYNDNSYVGPSSAAASVTTPADATAPTLIDAIDVGDSSKVLITFSERVDPVSAKVPANYALTGGITVSAAVLQAGSRSVLLTHSAMTRHTTYIVTVRDVKDQTARNAIAANSTVTFTYAYRKNLMCRYYALSTGVGSVDALNTLTPDTAEVVGDFSLWVANKHSRHDNYGLRYGGVIQIFEPGMYAFDMVVDDLGKLVIDGTVVLGKSPANYMADSLYLTRGKHTFEVSFVQGCCGEVLEPQWKGPGFGFQGISSSVFLHDPDALGGITGTKLVAPRAAMNTLLSVNNVWGRSHIRFAVPASSKGCAAVTISILDLRGRLIRTLTKGLVASGMHSVVFDGRTASGTLLSRGRYLVRYETNDLSLTRCINHMN